jgi:hypothetical protein
MHNIGTEMDPLFIGPMPVNEFLNEFLPVASIPGCSDTLVPFKEGAFQEVLKLKFELDVYDPFVSLL